jgi:hypothetical protein
MWVTSPSLTHTPPSLTKGRGQGDRLLDNLTLIKLAFYSIIAKLKNEKVKHW